MMIQVVLNDDASGVSCLANVVEVESVGVVLCLCFPPFRSVDAGLSISNFDSLSRLTL